MLLSRLFCCSDPGNVARARQRRADIHNHAPGTTAYVKLTAGRMGICVISLVVELGEPLCNRCRRSN